MACAAALLTGQLRDPHPHTALTERGLHLAVAIAARHREARTWAIWLTLGLPALSWSFAPFLFNPHQFERGAIVGTAAAWLAWLASSAAPSPPVKKKKKDPRLQSEEALELFFSSHQ